MKQSSSIITQPFEAQAQLLKVLTHPARLAILQILRDGEHCVCHMEAFLGYRQAYISQQLSVLRDAGLIHDRREGWNVFYRVAEPRIFAVLTAVEQILGLSQGASVEPSVIAIRAAGSSRAAVACTCPKCSAAKERK